MWYLIVLDRFLIFAPLLTFVTFSNSVDPDEMPDFSAIYLALHGLQKVTV